MAYFRLPVRKSAWQACVPSFFLWKTLMISHGINSVYDPGAKRAYESSKSNRFSPVFVYSGLQRMSVVDLGNDC